MMNFNFWDDLHLAYIAGGITPVRYPYPARWHRLPFLLIAQVTGGDVTVETSVHGPTPYGNRAIMIPPNLSFRITVHRNAEYVSRWCHLRLTTVYGLDLCELMETPLLIEDFETIRILGELCERMANITGGKSISPDLVSAARLKECGYSLLSIIAGIATIRDEHPLFSLQSRKIGALLKHIESHLADPLTRDGLAHECCLSASRFQRVFFDETGMSPMACVRKLRMKRACELLLQTDWSVGEIGIRVGYPDQYTFSRAFKNLHGSSPDIYRNNAALLFQ